jgi:4,4'-diaponeurosporenoate glycosyltransferase
MNLVSAFAMNFNEVRPDVLLHFALWLLGFLFLFRIFYCKVSDGQHSKNPGVSIIIPARNEEAGLPPLLQSLEGQLSSNDELIVVNDHSQDNTSLVGMKAGAKVLESLQAPEGWIGKTWACYQGARAAKGEILVFMDADTVLEKKGLEKIISTYSEMDGVISIQPYHRMQKLYEQLSAYFNLVMMAAMGAFTILGSYVKPVGLFGPVMVTKRQYYIDSGGHETTRGEILENMALGSSLKKKGLAVRCLAGKGTVSFRMYPNGINQLINGWSKGFAAGAANTSIILLILIIAWISGSIGTIRGLVESIIAGNYLQIVIWGSLYILYAGQIYWMLVRIGNFQFYTALLYPIPLAFFVLVFTYSFVRIFLGKSVNWKGRDIDLRRKVNK